jgi:hypothetical protein
MFFTFGLNTSALHLLPLVTMTGVGWLLGRWSEGAGSAALGAIAPCSRHPSRHRDGGSP